MHHLQTAVYQYSRAHPDKMLDGVRPGARGVGSANVPSPKQSKAKREREKERERERESANGTVDSPKAPNKRYGGPHGPGGFARSPYLKEEEVRSRARRIQLDRCFLLSLEGERERERERERKLNLEGGRGGAS